MNYWLLMSEPSECSIDHVLAAPGQTVPWFGVRNFQARSLMRDGMRVGDDLLFYHSNCPEPGIAGLAKVASEPRIDPTQFDKDSPYRDLGSKPEAPRWYLRDVQAICKTRLIGLAELRSTPRLAEMIALRRGNRLSITPVDPVHWRWITEQML